MHKRIFVSSVLVMAWVSSACALNDFTIKKPYPVASAALPGRIVPAHLVDVEVDPTLQGKPTTVGVKKNGYGHDTAVLYIQPEPAEWLTAAIETQFRASGLDLRAPADETTPRISVHVEQFFVEPNVGIWGADVTGMTILRVEVAFPQEGAVFERRFVGENTRFHVIWEDAQLRKNLFASAQRALVEAAARTKELVERRVGDAHGNS